MLARLYRMNVLKILDLFSMFGFPPKYIHSSQEGIYDHPSSHQVPFYVCILNLSLGKLPNKQQIFYGF